MLQRDVVHIHVTLNDATKLAQREDFVSRDSYICTANNYCEWGFIYLGTTRIIIHADICETTETTTKTTYKVRS